MSKNLRRLTLLFVTVCVMIIMAVPAFATVYYADSDTAAYYVQNDSDSSYYTSTPITVTLDVQSKRTSTSSTSSTYSKEIDVTLTPSTSKRYTVADVLIAVNKMTTENAHFQNYSGNDLDYGTNGSIPSYCYQATLDNVTYAPTSRTAIDGWMFRINGKFPLHSGTPGSNANGEAINTAYVKNGDRITFYMDNPDGDDFAALFSRIKEATYTPGATSDDNGTLTVKPQFSYNYYGSSYIWYITNYGLASGAVVEVYSSKTATTPLASGTTNSTGVASLSVKLNAGSTYYIRVQKTFYSGEVFINTTRCLAEFTA